MDNQFAKPASGKTRIALIDADGVLFAAACSSEICTKDGDEVLYLQKETAEQAYEAVIKRFKEIILKVAADRAIITLSYRENFRYDILPSYKGNRVVSRRPPMLTTLRDMIQERKPWPVMLVKGLEADDVCGISAGSLSNDVRETVICSPDKDLRTIPGLYYSCRLDAKVELITEEAADRFHLWQTLVGDIVDNYTGCPKVGKVAAENILLATDAVSPADRWAYIVKEFQKRGFDESYALTQARVARILRSTDWNAETHEVTLWEAPVNTAVYEQGEAA